jgi:hypothetical protein
MQEDLIGFPFKVKDSLLDILIGPNKNLIKIDYSIIKNVIQTTLMNLAEF